MLDQNTDRMWYVIGAVLIGAAIIFGANAMYPSAFASVGTMFDDLIEGVVIGENSIRLNYWEIGTVATEYGTDVTSSHNSRIRSDYVYLSEGDYTLTQEMLTDDALYVDTWLSLHEEAGGATTPEFMPGWKSGQSLDFSVPAGGMYARLVIRANRTGGQNESDRIHHDELMDIINEDVVIFIHSRGDD